MLPDVDGGYGVGDPGLVQQHTHSFGGGFVFEGPVGDEGAGEGGQTGGC